MLIEGALSYPACLARPASPYAELFRQEHRQAALVLGPEVLDSPATKGSEALALREAPSDCPGALTEHVPSIRTSTRIPAVALVISCPDPCAVCIAVPPVRHQAVTG